MARSWQSQLERWRQAGLIEPATADAIRAWEQARPEPARLRIPVLVAIALGGVLVAAGLLLFVSTHWEALGPAQRFCLLLALVVGLHGGGAAVEERFPPLAVALHGVGTVTLGAGIFLAAQIFHLEAHWPLGLLLWAIGAGLGWALLRQWPQLALLALLVPAWLGSEWAVAVQERTNGLHHGAGDPTALAVPAAGLLLTCLSYLAAPIGAGPATPARRVLLWIGGLGLLPTALFWLVVSLWGGNTMPLPLPLAFFGWALALGGPLLMGWCLRGARAWPVAVALGWLLPSLAMAWGDQDAVGLFTYLWWAVGGLLLLAWGVAEGRSERINFGMALIALDVLAFYVSQVMGALGRSASLIGLGVLFLGGGWGLELLRRRLVARAVRPEAP
ncbi:DUF2157 domain-containing protein [Vulcanococcus limneticus Candia 3F8]|uniref:DUF2157 domain-containing protein n=1 Tax=Vulcanococcus limneticus TaxID=2170428 RepID=UPI000B98C1A5|nr:DUF2157 domain-containing protein [Vulcanococcus limneticus]MCP9792262.1 DUF2157 domain-containing protein [Vulcanococcus limneticus MW73D5]MCP9894278.1 DUF2157 domain-containing protein [Vulcanococcus limneticus Candia 3F8]MCP9897911.1 DUF2157 domain-containing protein [Vulcanococcus limneticus Candia 3B3]